MYVLFLILKETNFQQKFNILFEYGEIYTGGEGLDGPPPKKNPVQDPDLIQQCWLGWFLHYNYLYIYNLSIYLSNL